MSVHFNLKRLRPNLDGLGFLIDVGMILLVIANLSLILFDWIYRVEACLLYTSPSPRDRG